MTGNDILKLAESMVDDSLQSTDAVLWINLCLTDLGIKARVYGDVLISVAAETWQPLPSDFLAVAEIETDTGYRYLGDYRIRSGTIRFPVNGSYAVHYHRIPVKITTLDDEIDAHQLLEPAIACFVAAQFKLQDDDENPMYGKLLAQYEASLDKAVAMIDSYRQDGSMKIEVVY